MVVVAAFLSPFSVEDADKVSGKERNESGGGTESSGVLASLPSEQLAHPSLRIEIDVA